MRQHKSGIFSQWLIEGFPQYRVGSDKKMYKLPYHSHNGFREVREIKIQPPRRYKLNNTWWSTKQLRAKLVLDKNPIILLPEISDCPF